MCTDQDSHFDTDSWVRSLGVPERERKELEQTVSGLAEERGKPISEAAYRVNQHDLMLLYRLIRHLSLNPKGVHECPVFKSLRNAVRKIGGLQSEDIQCEASHQAYAIEAESDHRQTIKLARDQLNEIAIKTRDQQDLLGSLFSGEQNNPAAHGAADRLSRDAAWTSECLNELRSIND